MAELTPGTRFGGDYEILRVLGAGGMATVYEAREEPIGRVVALKVLDRAEPALRTRFLAEARTMAALRHPGLAQILRFGTDPATGIPFLAMKSYPRTLADRLAGSRALAEADAAALGLRLADALAALHAADPPVVHRDLKPSNVLLDESGAPVLSDFGVAKRLAPDETQLTLASLGGQPGTWAWAAPEQRAGLPPTPAADWHAFGLLLYRCLTGGLPAPGGELPLDIAATVSRAWRPLLRGLLREDPGARLADPDAIRAALRRVLRSVRRRAALRRLRAPLAVLALAALLAAGAVSAARAIKGRAEAPSPSEPAGAAPFPAKDWARQHADRLREILAATIHDPVPDAANRIVVRTGEILLSGDIAPSAEPPTVILDGGALHFSPGAAALRDCIRRCDQFVAQATGNETKVPNVIQKRREMFRNPIFVTENGGHLDHADDTFATLVGPIGLAPGNASGELDVFGSTEIVIDRDALADSRLAVTGCGQIGDVLPNGLVRNRRWFDPDDPL